MARTKQVAKKAPKKAYSPATFPSTSGKLKTTAAPRVKGKNWSNEEEESLLKFCQPHLSIIESKKSDDVTTDQRNTAWQTIVDNMNANNDRVCNVNVIIYNFLSLMLGSFPLTFQHRTVTEARNKLKNIKKKLRSAFAAHRMALLKTGGGPPPPPITFKSEHEMALYNHISLSAEGLSSQMDSDSLFTEDDETTSQTFNEVNDDGNDARNNDGNDNGNDDENTLSPRNEGVDDDSNEVAESVEPILPEGEIIEHVEAEETEREQHQPMTPSTSWATVALTSTLASKVNCGKYTPKLLRTPVSKSLVVKKPQSDNILKLREMQMKQAIALEKEKHDLAIKEALKQAERAEIEHRLRVKLMQAELRAKYGINDENEIDP